MCESAGLEFISRSYFTTSSFKIIHQIKRKCNNHTLKKYLNHNFEKIYHSSFTFYLCYIIKNGLTLRIIDKFLIKAFVPPFIVAFGIALFVLVMQFLWVYIDEIMGKGLNLLDITELIFYLSMTMVPMALPIGVLISSVMVMGNLAERYELSSFKSAGVGLVRVMRPLVFAVGTIVFISIFVSERVIPWANLKFYSRFYDIRKSKPTLTFQEGIFNDEFEDYTMRIGKKGEDGKSLENVMIYSNKRYNTSQINQSQSQKGEMFTTADGQYIVMNLFNGMQFQETVSASNTNNKNYPFVRIKFKSWQKIFDLSQFDKKKTGEGAFGGHQKMKNSYELLQAVDSVGRTEENINSDMARNVGEVFTPMKSPLYNKKDTLKNIGKTDSVSISKTDTVAMPKGNHFPVVADNKISKISSSKSSIQAKMDSMSRARLAGTPYEKKSVLSSPSVSIVRKDTSIKSLPPFFYDIEKNRPPYELQAIRSTADSKAKNAKTAIESAMTQLGSMRDSQGRYLYEMNMKYSYALICLVFLFIGAPMGAIIQKGGFGMPILVAIVFFMIYMVGIIFCKNLKDTHDISYISAAWIPLLVELPIAIILTYRAVNDFKMINFDFKKLLSDINPKNLFLRFKNMRNPA
jgi:lipopolysaccharide export system permease protein